MDSSACRKRINIFAIGRQLSPLEDSLRVNENAMMLALDYVIDKNSTEILRLPLNYDVRDEELNRSLLTVACSIEDDEKSIKLEKLLFETGLDVHGRTPLHNVASTSNYGTTVKTMKNRIITFLTIISAFPYIF